MKFKIIDNYDNELIIEIDYELYNLMNKDNFNINSIDEFIDVEIIKYYDLDEFNDVYYLFIYLKRND